MWACRSFPSRPRTVLNSIRRRRVTEPPAVVLAGAAASRDLVSDTAATDRSPPPAATGEKKHLFLVLDDAKYGFGIHKLDIDAAASASASGAAADDDVEFEDLPRLPTPPVVRIGNSWVNHFAVLGSNVIGMSSGIRDVYDSRSDGDTLTFDTKTAELALLPDLPDGLRKGCVRLAVAASANRLYVIEDGTQYPGADYDDELCWGGLHCLKLQEDDADDGKIKEPSGPRTTSPGTDHRGRGTFSYDIEHGFWRRHGDWEVGATVRGQGSLPYAGLRAWVGLHRQGNAYKGFKPDGHICACKVPSLDGVEVPGWKLCKERLFMQDPQQRVDAKLVDMGCGGRFCLVKIKTEEEGVDRKGGVGGDGEECVLRLTTFGVEYDDDGELVVIDRRPAGSFKVAKYHDFPHIYSDY
ncbi:unnamed protein product [Urochloa decumbens]|uniref:Uncharacterized protein n=1 Tax=Urochloa decumbens TaxID=240449 RepID=A0ABC9A0P6_9POAL